MPATSRGLYLTAGSLLAFAVSSAFTGAALVVGGAARTLPSLEGATNFLGIVPQTNIVGIAISLGGCNVGAFKGGLGSRSKDRGKGRGVIDAITGTGFVLAFVTQAIATSGFVGSGEDRRGSCGIIDNVAVR